MRKTAEIVLGLVVWEVFGLGSSVGCRKGGINQSTATLAFSSPGALSAVTTSGQEVTIDFGPVPVGAISILAIDVTSISGAGVTITGVSSLQASSAFAFPLSSGSTVETAPPTVVQATFAPTAVGVQSASWKIALGSSPPITLTLQGNGFPFALTVSPNPVNFGNVELHNSPSLLVTVTNDSSQSVDLTVAPPDGGPFTVGPLPNGPLAPGGSLTFNATYAPLLVETDHSSFTLTSCEGCSAGSAQVQVPLEGAGVLSTLSYPNPLKFGFVTPHNSGQKILALKNIGSTSIQIRSQPILDPGSFVPPVYKFSGTAPVSYPYTITAGSELDLPITFSPPQIGIYTDATVTLSTSDPENPTPIVSLQGYGGGAQISCQPSSLDLGPVAVGYATSQSLLCLNAGTAIPGHPEANLQLSQSQLSTDNPHFSATLLGAPADGGLLSLPAGQSATLAVSFNPTDAGPESSILNVGSNDVAHDPLAVPLTGLGVVPGACNDFAVLPAGGLDFGEVPQGGSAQLQFEINNLGNGYCVVQDVALASGADAGFSLPGGPVAYQLVSFPGDPNNTTNLPTQLRIAVQFAPTQVETAAQGAVGFQIVNASPQNQSVLLRGSSAPACLTFSPTQLNFGLVGFNATSDTLCFKPTQRVSMQNSCASPVTIESIQLNPELDSLPQFALQGLPTLPVSLSAGEEIGFETQFQATQSGAKAEVVQIVTGEFSEAYSLSLTGDAEGNGRRTDSFVVPQKQLDLVLLLDTDDELGEDMVTEFENQIPALIGAANSAQLDYQIAVVTDATCSSGDQGAFSPCPTCNLVGTAPTYVTAQSQPNPTSVLSQLVTATWASQDVCQQQGTQSPNSGAFNDEQFFEVPLESFSSALLTGHNAGFLRDNAYLAILSTNSDTEDDYTDLSPDAVVGFLQGLKADPALISWSHIYVDPTNSMFSDLIPRIAQVSDATGGILVNENTPGWQNQLLNLFSATVGLGSFPLGALPDSNSLQISVNGVSIPSSAAAGYTNWSYDSVHNAVVFSLAALPPIGSTVTIGYSLSCS